jgi:hypothetical protein
MLRDFWPSLIAAYKLKGNFSRFCLSAKMPPKTSCVTIFVFSNNGVGCSLYRREENGVRLSVLEHGGRTPNVVGRKQTPRWAGSQFGHV